MQIRTPAVAGMFYPENSNDLKNTIQNCFLHTLGPGVIPPSNSDEKIFGVISPHAGYMYSGPIACHSYYSISSETPELVIIVGPNHWGIGCNVAVMKEGKWQTPLGDTEIDSQAVTEIVEECKLIEMDYFSHTKDHSLEVQLPMLQETLQQNFKILPLILIDQSYESTKEVGLAISKLAKQRKIMIIGSSDFTHYETNEFAYEQDHALINPILELDVEQFYEVLEKRKVSACGYGAIASTMTACKELGASKGKLLKYATSGDVSEDKNSVVGYASIVFT